MHHSVHAIINQIYPPSLKDMDILKDAFYGNFVHNEVKCPIKN